MIASASTEDDDNDDDCVSSISSDVALIDEFIVGDMMIICFIER